MAPTLLVLLTSFKKASKRWIIIKYHSICKHTELMDNTDQKPTHGKFAGGWTLEDV